MVNNLAQGAGSYLEYVIVLHQASVKIFSSELIQKY